MLVVIAPVAWKGFNNVLTGFNRWTWARAGNGRVHAAAGRARPPKPAASSINLTGRFFAEVLLLGALGVVAVRHLERDELAHWLWETWRFVKQIFPLLIVGRVRRRDGPRDHARRSGSNSWPGATPSGPT